MKNQYDCTVSLIWQKTLIQVRFLSYYSPAVDPGPSASYMGFFWVLTSVSPYVLAISTTCLALKGSDGPCLGALWPNFPPLAHLPFAWPVPPSCLAQVSPLLWTPIKPPHHPHSPYYHLHSVMEWMSHTLLFQYLCLWCCLDYLSACLWRPLYSFRLPISPKFSCVYRYST